MMASRPTTKAMLTRSQEIAGELFLSWPERAANVEKVSSAVDHVICAALVLDLQGNPGTCNYMILEVIRQYMCRRLTNETELQHCRQEERSL